MPAGRRDRVSNQATRKEGGVRGGGRCLDGGDGDEAPVRDGAGGGVDEARNEEREERRGDERQRLVAREAAVQAQR